MKHTYRTPAEAQHVRTQACALAAQVLASRPDEPEPMHMAWTLATFFESYITMGHAATMREFGPKPPVMLSVVRKEATQ